MGSRGKSSRKRRHFSSNSPAAGKNQSSAPLSEEKKLDAAVLQFQNEKLTQKLETQKVEFRALEEKLHQLDYKQQLHEQTLAAVNNSWEEVAGDLETQSSRILESTKHVRDFECHQLKDGGNSPQEDALLSRVLETGATESSSPSTSVNTIEEDRKIEWPNKTLHNIVSSFDELNGLKHRLHNASLKAISPNFPSEREVSSDLQTEVKKLRMMVLKLHLEHRSLAKEVQSHRDIDARNKASLKHLEGELESTLAELQESNNNLEILKAEQVSEKALVLYQNQGTEQVERDHEKGALVLYQNEGNKQGERDLGKALVVYQNRGNKQVEQDQEKGALILYRNQGNKQLTIHKSKDKERDLQDMESSLKELLHQSACRLHQLNQLHVERLDMLRRVADLQNHAKNVKHINSTQAFRSMKDQAEKAKSDAVKYHAFTVKSQIERESIYWWDKERHLHKELLEALHRISALSHSKISDLEIEIRRYVKEKDLIVAKLKNASKEPGRKDIPGLKALASSFPEKMRSMQDQLAKHKETAAGLHCLQAEVESLTNILNRKANEWDILTSGSAQQNAEVKNLKLRITCLESTAADLKRFQEMYAHASADSREVEEARDSELKAWAHVQGLTSSLDERNLELRVKVAIEAEAKSQQRLATAEAEIAELRQKLEASKREKAKLSNVLKSKTEETEAYIAEIETIGQAYDDMHNHNQELLRQITEKDDYNEKLVIEGARARQLEDALLVEKNMLEKAVQPTRKVVTSGDFKVGRVGNQLKALRDHLKRVAEDDIYKADTMELVQTRLLDTKKSSQQLTSTLDETQSQVERSRGSLTDVQIQREKNRFRNKRVEEDLDDLRSKVQQLESQAQSSSVNEKLQQELKGYKEILICSVCNDRRKEVVITKCYHLFCNACVQRILNTRHRKCPACSASFGANDVKPVYI
ncbi:E3 ubiquitin-protein ligase BRE1-like 1 [Andrographis paniculata]|uniref:E3 ubiquitin-protein ligase BRE1-like 1 n=1 Tax=Andrographis paniculata TaxID=175694 RepID=UPI0021E8F607|nr:E3 ubiquitin-protein ligase BRE1-like 1 [Andrographis paniculata]